MTISGHYLLYYNMSVTFCKEIFISTVIHKMENILFENSQILFIIITAIS